MPGAVDLQARNLDGGERASGMHGDMRPDAKPETRAAVSSATASRGREEANGTQGRSR